MDERLINNIQPLDNVSIVDKLNPVFFSVKATKEKKVGLVAQELAKVEPILVKNSGQVLHVNYEALTVILLLELKQLKREIELLKEKKSKKAK